MKTAKIVVNVRIGANARTVVTAMKVAAIARTAPVTTAPVTIANVTIGPVRTASVKSDPVKIGSAKTGSATIAVPKSAARVVRAPAGSSAIAAAMPMRKRYLPRLCLAKVFRPSRVSRLPMPTTIRS